MPTNAAAWIRTPGARLTVDEAPYTPPSADQLLVRVAACAINPLDYKLQDGAAASFQLSYPTILGSDVAGTVVEAGANVKALRVGDRVLGHATGFSRGAPPASAFQLYTILSPALTTLLPESVSFEAAAGLPLALDTAAASLFQANHLGLSVDGLGASEAASSSDVLVVWGASSSVGCSAVQLARAAGVAVLATASEKNFALCKELGAEATFDYRGEGVVERIVAQMRGRNCVGVLDCVGDEATQLIGAEILSHKDVSTSGAKRVVTVLTPREGLELPPGVEVKRCFIPPMFQTAIPPTVHAWVSKALGEGRFLPRPVTKVVGHGLEAIQGGLDELRKGVSATKLVVKL